jgi:hypothetical protein
MKVSRRSSRQDWSHWQRDSEFERAKLTFVNWFNGWFNDRGIHMEVGRIGPNKITEPGPYGSMRTMDSA